MITEKDLDSLRTSVGLHMNPSRYRHTLGVEREMRFLSSSLAPSLLFEAAAAGLLHDVTKCLSFDGQRDYCAKNAIPVTEDETLAPALLHAKTGAHFACANYPQFVTEGVYDAILRHTTAEAPLSLLAAMLFVADFTEEGRDYPDCVRLRAMLREKPLSGDEGIAHFKRVLLAALDASLMELVREGRPVALCTVKARNAVLANNLLF